MGLRLEHPDVHWFFPLPRPKVSGGSDKLAEALEDARAAELEARRSDPYYLSDPGEIMGIYLAHAQVIRRLAASRPAMAARKIFVIGDAELLVPQEASPEAANALLKLFEEPPPDTTLIVTAADPEALLPTVRSRLRAIRVMPLSEAEVTEFLTDERGLDAERARLVARLSAGSIGRALGFVGQDVQAGPLETARTRARALLEAACLPSPVERYAAALGLPPAGARGEYATTLDFLVLWLRDLAAATSGAMDAVVNLDATLWLGERARALPRPDAVLDAIALTEDALRLTQFNINPQLGLAHLLHELSRTLGVPGELAGASGRP
jgi:DNA polymerase-3 subunit delta'